MIWVSTREALKKHWYRLQLVYFCNTSLISSRRRDMRKKSSRQYPTVAYRCPNYVTPPIVIGQVLGTLRPYCCLRWLDAKMRPQTVNLSVVFEISSKDVDPEHGNGRIIEGSRAVQLHPIHLPHLDNVSVSSSRRLCARTCSYLP